MSSRRERLISQSILDAVFGDQEGGKRGFLSWVFTFFSLFRLYLSRWDGQLFKKLRNQIWKLSEDEYRESFRSKDKKGKLDSIGDLGYSGSTFFTTPNSKFLIKSLPRHFEHAFFKWRLLGPYAAHMQSHPSSLLVRITDLLYAPHFSIGRMLRVAPSHHIVMENILYGRESSQQSEKWETYDLKPRDYFFPERDVAGGALASESVKDRLIDTFDDKIRVSSSQRKELLEILQADTTLLESANAVDYSIFVVRFPVSNEPTPTLRSKTSSWRTGLKSSDGKWVYRTVILDFFWAKNSFQAKLMDGLIRGYNLFDQKGPMSITTTPEEYKKRFMSMIEEIVEAAEDE